MNDCGSWPKKSFESAAERSINRPQIRKHCTWRPSQVDRAPSFTAGINMNLCSFALTFCVWFSLTPGLLRFFFPLFPCHFQVNYSIQNPNRNVRFQRKISTWIQIRHDDIKFLGSTFPAHQKFSNCSQKNILVSFCSLLVC